MGENTVRRKRGLVAPRHVLGGALMGAGLLLLAFAAGSAAATPAPTPQCPDGYHWDRLSGVGCVQTRLPAHGKYSYTQAAICVEPYISAYAPGPNAYGRDPNANYLVACLTPEQAAASAGANPTPATYDGGGNDADDMLLLGSGPLDDLAAGLAENGKNTIPPTPSDADLGGVAATGLLLLSAGGAAVVSGGAGSLSGLAGGGAGGSGGSGGGAGSGGGGAGGGAAPDAEPAKAAGRAAAKGAKAAATAAAQAFPNVPPLPQVGGVTTAATSGLPLPKPELIAAGLSIFRSMKRVTSDVDESGYGAGDIAELIGDATTIGALASIIAPAANVIELLSSGASAAADSTDPKVVLDRLRRSFGQLGYMQGILDENIDRLDGKLRGLDGAPEAGAVSPAPPVPADVSTLTYKQLREARSTWAARADVAFDALIAAQADLADLDDRRRNLSHQIDAVNDLLANLDNAGTLPVPPHLADTLRYGLGWYKVADPDRMVAALREARLMGPAPAAQTAEPAAAGPGASDGKPAGKGKRSAGKAKEPPPKPVKPSRGTPFAQWAAENGFISGRINVLEALAGLERWCGFYDALTGTIQGQIAILRAQADTASATRRTLSAEIQHRSLEGAE